MTLNEKELSACPCGATPKALCVTDNGQSGKWANVCGDCCGEWMVEFRTNYKPLDSAECMEQAAKAWNEAPRHARKEQAEQIDALRKDAELYRELIMAVGKKFPGESRHQTALRYIRQAEEPCGGTGNSVCAIRAEGKPI